MWIAHHCVSSFLIHCLYCCCAMRRKRGQVAAAIDKRSFLIGGLRCSYAPAASCWLKLRPPAQYTCSLNIPIVWSIGFSKGWRLKPRSNKKDPNGCFWAKSNQSCKENIPLSCAKLEKENLNTRLILFAWVLAACVRRQIHLYLQVFCQIRSKVIQKPNLFDKFLGSGMVIKKMPLSSAQLDTEEVFFSSWWSLALVIVNIYTQDNFCIFPWAKMLVS